MAVDSFNSNILLILVQLVQNLTKEQDTSKIENLLIQSLSAFNTFSYCTYFSLEDQEFSFFFANLLVLYAAYLHNPKEGQEFHSEWKTYMEVKNTESFKDEWLDKSWDEPHINDEWDNT